MSAIPQGESAPISYVTGNWNDASKVFQELRVANHAASQALRTAEFGAAACIVV
jgi:hypothetical protein